MYGRTVVRPLFYEFPTDEASWPIDRQFLVGASLLVSPVLGEGERSVRAYFPAAVWYDFWTLQRITDGKQSQWLTLDTPLDHIQVPSLFPLLLISCPCSMLSYTQNNSCTYEVVESSHCSSRRLPPRRAGETRSLSMSPSPQTSRPKATCSWYVSTYVLKGLAHVRVCVCAHR